MAQELLDIYDEQMNYIGTVPRAEAHAKGYWHKTFQCWIVRVQDQIPYLLFQKRHPRKDSFPGKLDKSSAGHLVAGETVADGVRELREELGISVSFDELIPCGVVRVTDETHEGIVDREFCHVFIYESNRPLHAYRLKSDEVSGLYQVRVDDFAKLVRGQISSVSAEGLEPDDSGQMRRVVKKVSIDDFTPQNDTYFDMLFHKLEQLAYLRE